MKKSFTLIAALAALAIVAGCQSLGTATPDNPLGTIDPNEVQVWIDSAVAAGQAAQAVGIAVGRPVVYGAGVLLVTLGGVLSAALLRRQ